MFSKWQKPLHKEEALKSHLLISQPLAARISTVPCGFKENPAKNSAPSYNGITVGCWAS
jgi:hypothetical protein